MLWLIVAILSSLISAFVVLIDRYLLKGLMLPPKVYAFYVGAFGILALALFPFGFYVPSPLQIFLALLVGIFQILGVLFYY